jgi:hypothetical protein
MRKFIQGVLKMTTKPFHVRVKVSGNQSVKINMESKNGGRKFYKTLDFY